MHNHQLISGRHGTIVLDHVYTPMIVIFAIHAKNCIVKTAQKKSKIINTMRTIKDPPNDLPVPNLQLSL